MSNLTHGNKIVVDNKIFIYFKKYKRKNADFNKSERRSEIYLPTIIIFIVYLSKMKKDKRHNDYYDNYTIK